MNVTVMSPHARGSGVTTVACLLAQELAGRNRKVCLTHAAAWSETLLPFFGLERREGNGTRARHVVGLVKEGAIRDGDVGDYCRPVSEGLDLFSLDSGKLTPEDRESLVRFICTRNAWDHVVIDADFGNDLDDPVAREVLRCSDCVVYVMTQNAADAARFRAEGRKILSRIGKLPCVVVVNRYCDVVGTTKALAARMGMRNPGDWLTVRHNHWIANGTENGRLKELRESMDKRDCRVVDADSDFKGLASAALRVKKANEELAQLRRWKSEEERGERVGKLPERLGVPDAREKNGGKRHK